MGFVQACNGLDPVLRVVLFFQLAQAQTGAIVHGYFHGGSGVVFHGNVFEDGHEAHFLQRLLVVFHVFVRFGGAFVIVEGNTGRDYIEHYRALVGDGSLQHRVKLLLVARKRPAHKGCAQRDGHSAGVDRREIVDHASF